MFCSYAKLKVIREARNLAAPGMEEMLDELLPARNEVWSNMLSPVLKLAPQLQQQALFLRKEFFKQTCREQSLNSCIHPVHSISMCTHEFKEVCSRILGGSFSTQLSPKQQRLKEEAIQRDLARVVRK